MRYLPAGVDEATFRAALADSVGTALLEDVGTGDVSAALIDPGVNGIGHVITRDHGVIAGLEWVAEVCRQVDERIEFRPDVADGDRVAPDQQLFSELLYYYDESRTIRSPVDTRIIADQLELKGSSLDYDIATSKYKIGGRVYGTITDFNNP
jgi:hypothetical protein